MPSPKISKIGPLSADEAKWTELRKIEVWIFSAIASPMLTLNITSGSIRLAREYAEAILYTYQ